LLSLPDMSEPSAPCPAGTVGGSVAPWVAVAGSVAMLAALDPLTGDATDIILTRTAASELWTLASLKGEPGGTEPSAVALTTGSTSGSAGEASVGAVAALPPRPAWESAAPSEDAWSDEASGSVGGLSTVPVEGPVASLLLAMALTSTFVVFEELFAARLAFWSLAELRRPGEADPVESSGPPTVTSADEVSAVGAGETRTRRKAAEIRTVWKKRIATVSS